MTHVMTDTDCERAFKGLPARKDLELELQPAYVMLCQMYQEYKKTIHHKRTVKSDER